MAIGIVMTGYCKDCPVAALELIDLDVDIGNEYVTKWLIHCKREAACERIFKGRFANDKDDKEKESNK